MGKEKSIQQSFKMNHSGESSKTRIIESCLQVLQNADCNLSLVSYRSSYKNKGVFADDSKNLIPWLLSTDQTSLYSSGRINKHLTYKTPHQKEPF